MASLDESRAEPLRSYREEAAKAVIRATFPLQDPPAARLAALDRLALEGEALYEAAADRGCGYALDGYIGWLEAPMEGIDYDPSELTVVQLTVAALRRL
ncbi:hypothetical protein [Geodermatophilus sp. DSM 45219]|uniref:hypothetical protein n=1 Tax=Geodermatophilus sp. DSM 45219 TaxID=1881103 RepID=UPI000B857E9A|nr:hypothetical protein [Geodermatophilus sp. DSM 45219]